MFDVWCPVRGSNVLRWWSHVIAVTNQGQGVIDLLLRCDCDQLVLRRTGRGQAGVDQTIHGIDPAAVDAPTLRRVDLVR